MNILDENIIYNQCLFLKNKRIPFRQIGHQIGHKGIEDREIISLLHNLKNPTFFTRDNDFYQSKLCHNQYCIVFLAVKKDEVGIFIHRFLHHENFNTVKKRLGSVVKITHTNISIKKLNFEKEIKITW